MSPFPFSDDGLPYRPRKMRPKWGGPQASRYRDYTLLPAEDQMYVDLAINLHEAGEQVQSVDRPKALSFLRRYHPEVELT